jgi:hypothetical protein
MQNLNTQAAVNAARDALYRREASGEGIAESAWLAVGDAQDALNNWTPEGYVR